jgi:gamma-glutamyl-gamma-aminobutyrate hydrolase PuuD
MDVQVYISTVESKKYPVLGLQWHPEKNSFEWTRHKQIPHGYWSTEVTHQVLSHPNTLHRILLRMLCRLLVALSQ